MIIGMPWGLLGLLAIPAIIVIHLFRQTYREQTVSGLFLYGETIEVSASGRQRQPLIKRASLWWELLAALVLTIWLSDIHFSDREHARHHIWVFDSTFSLQAIGQDGLNSQERLHNMAREVASGLKHDDRLTIMISGTTPQMLAGPAEAPQRAMMALSAWHCDQPWHDLADSVAFALELAGNPQDSTTNAAEVILWSDRTPDFPLGRSGLMTGGTAVNNLAINDAHWFASDARGDERITIQIANYSALKNHATLTLRDHQESTLEQRQITINAGEKALLHLPVLRTTHYAPVHIDISLEDTSPALDGLSYDNHVRILPPSTSKVKVYLSDLHTITNDAISKAIHASGLAQIVEDEHLADLIIAPDAQPKPGVWAISCPSAGASSSSPSADQQHMALGPFLAQRGHPSLRDCDFTGCMWPGGNNIQNLANSPTDVLLSSGQTALISVTAHYRSQHLRLYGPLQGNGLLYHPSWPALWYNIIHWRHGNLPGVNRRNLSLGQALQVTLPIGHRQLIAKHDTHGDITMQTDPHGQTILPSLPQTGRWRLSSRGGERSGDEGSREGDEKTGQQDQKGKIQQALTEVQVIGLDSRASNCLDASTEARPAEMQLTGDQVVRRPSLIAQLILASLLIISCIAALRCYLREQG